MPRATSGDVIDLSERRRERLEAILRAQTAPQREVRRARIVLAAAQGQSNAAIARQVGVGVDTVRSTRARFAAEGMPALADRPRSGRPLVYGPEVRIHLIAAVTSTPPAPETVWTGRMLAAHLTGLGFGISASQIGRILADCDLKPHLVRGWLNRPDDPEFFTRAQAICDLYLNPPAGGVLLSLDEKTGIQAKSRKHPTRALAAGSPARQEFEYVRHGTVSLMAAMNVTDGQVLGTIITRNNSVTFIEFLTEIDHAIPAHQNIHLVMDNGSSHTSKATRAWLTTHPRFQVTYTPKHASWLNMVEIFFSILTRRILRRGEYTSRDHLATAILDFITTYDDTAKPFRWTYDGRPLKAA